MSEKEYREGNDPVDDSVPTAQPGSEAATPGWFKEGEGNPEGVDTSTAPQPGPESDQPPGLDTEVFTAVLLVQTHNGTVFPITNLDNLKLHHNATPHEVLRMCLDAADQISAVRIIGEVLRNNHVMLQRNFGALAQGLGLTPVAQDQTGAPAPNKGVAGAPTK